MRVLSSGSRIFACLVVLAVVGLAVSVEYLQLTFTLRQGGPREAAARVAPTLASPLMHLASLPESVELIKPIAPPAGDLPTWSPGYQWHYRWTDPRGSGTYIRSVTGEEWIDGVPFYLMRTGNRVIYWGKTDLAWVMERVNGEVESQAVPIYRKFAWPLRPGKTWESRYRWANLGHGTTEERVRRHRVAGIESVQVPAGTFQAYRIIVTDSTGKKLSEYWYSSDVRWLVKDRLYLAHGVRERELIYASLWPKTAAH